VADGISVVFEGLSAFRDAIDKMIVDAGVTARRIVTDGGHLIEAAAKARAPVQRGTLRRSIRVAEVTPIGAGAWLSRTGPTVIYGRRIELGFKGADSLGRVYHQAGRPYLAPGFDEVKGKLGALAEARWREALRS